jgi:C_GCAxxG_C_C family probable redox protein
MEQFGIEDKMVLRAAGGFHGGMMCSLTCGIVTGAMMFLGLLIGRENIEEGMEGLMPIIMPAQELVSLFTKRLGSSSCKELTGVDFTDLNQAIAFQMSGDNKKCLDRMEQGAEELALFLIEKQKKGELFRIS